MEKWTNELQHSYIALAAVILGLVPDFSIGSMHAVHDMLEKRMAEGKVENRKEGEHRGAPSFYKAKFFDKDHKAA
jgi:hypothetical protein